jgi:CRP-like cAMP-binding protein
MDIERPWRRHPSVDAGLGTSVDLCPGTRLTAEGAPGSEFFIVHAGHVAVQRQGREVAVLGPGDHFGEIALLHPRARRTATVVAADDLRVQVFDRREFSTLLDRDPAFGGRILRHAVERLLSA